MELREAYETIFEDILITKELGFDKKINQLLALKIIKELMNKDYFLFDIEEALASVITEGVDELADEFELYDE